MSISVPGESTAFVRMKTPEGPMSRMIPRWLLTPWKNSQVSLRLILRFCRLEQDLRQSLDSKSEPQMCNSSARPLRTMNFVQFSLKRVVEESDAGIAPQCLQDAAG